MTDGPQSPALHLVADLHLDVDGVPVQVSGDGAEVVVETPHPLRLLRSAAATSLPASTSARSALAVVGDALADNGVSVVVQGPHGPLAGLGVGIDSRVGALVAGTRHAAVHVPARWSAVGAVVLAAAAGVLVGRRIAGS